MSVKTTLFNIVTLLSAYYEVQISENVRTIMCRRHHN